MTHHKPQPHHYETSGKANIISFIITVLVFAAIMYYFVGLRNQPFDLAFTNRGLAIASVFLIGFSYILGPLARFAPRTFVPKLEYRKPFGLYGYFFAIIHILMSLMIVSGEELGSNGLSLVFGMGAILTFTLVASTSTMKSIEAYGFKRWQKIQRMGYFAFLLVILHFSVLENGAFLTRQLGQITAAFAAIVILARLIILMKK